MLHIVYQIVLRTVNLSAETDCGIMDVFVLISTIN